MVDAPTNFYAKFVHKLSRYFLGNRGFLSKRFTVTGVTWCEKGDSNHIPCSLKPCNCKAWEARLPICLHFCLHSAIQFLGNGCSSLQSFFARKVCISLCTGRRFVTEVFAYMPKTQIITQFLQYLHYQVIKKIISYASKE